ncbi:hypothetical protein PDL07_08340 [Bacillus cereus]|uniref:hypothetical protein n=1 Tax=Bacillus cereus TaxID=1396 RepID=UPI002ABEDBD6|nr:hypothetical protein [Bacillus cereus]MDA1782685.1 hypothetical protein [Bacillus cereus]MDZ4537939.1 hypothetical protein [Bacillus cereus]
MDSHFRLTSVKEDDLVDYLKQSYSDPELYSLCRQLEIDKNDIFSKYLPKKQNCENLVETIQQKDLMSELFQLLQSEKFYRKRLIETFPDLDLQSPIEFEELRRLVEKVYTINNETSDSSQNSMQWVKACKEKMVLVLGKDSPQEYMKELEDICECVEKMGYTPILIKKQDEIETITNEEKMLAYASISRFVIIEKSYPAGQIDEAKICAINRFPTIWLQKEGMGDTWMQGDYHIDQRSIQIFKYKDENVKGKLEEAVKWVEQFIKEKSESLNDLYPWR